MSCAVHVARGHTACTKMFTMVSFVFYKGSVVKKKKKETETEDTLHWWGGFLSHSREGQKCDPKEGRGACLWASSKCSQGKGDAGRVLWREERDTPLLDQPPRDQWLL